MKGSENILSALAPVLSALQWECTQRKTKLDKTQRESAQGLSSFLPYEEREKINISPCFKMEVREGMSSHKTPIPEVSWYVSLGWFKANTLQ